MMEKAFLVGLGVVAAIEVALQGLYIVNGMRAVVSAVAGSF